MERTGACSSCGRKLFPDDSFCSGCGTGVQEDPARTGFTRRTELREHVPSQDRVTCGSCNTLLLSGEVFCPTCGARAPDTSLGDWDAGRKRATTLQILADSTRGRFEFLRELGRGGMGTVFLARELELDRLVAVKALSANWLSDESMIERFRQEAKLIASFRHPSIVQVHGVGQVEGIHYFIMEFIDGVSIGHILRVHGKLPLRVIKAVFHQIGSALSYAHGPGRGVIHRDVKPSNIMVDGEGNAFVTDFGISKVAKVQSGLTRTGHIIGTPEYMSPEQCRGDVATFASDQYGLGVVIYTMLAGTPPFTGLHYRVLTGHTSQPPPPIRDLRPDCPNELADVLDRMLAKQPGERFPDIKHAMNTAGVGPYTQDDPARGEIEQLVARTSETESPGPAEAGPGRPAYVGAEDRNPTGPGIPALHGPLEPGDEVRLNVSSFFGDGHEVEKEAVTWDSTDPGVARIDPTTGDLVAVAEGSAVISALAADVERSQAVEVKPPRVAEVTIEPDELEIGVGDKGQLTAQATSRRGDVLDRPVSWSSISPAHASVSEEGIVCGHEEGSAIILARCEGVEGASRATVLPATGVGQDHGKRLGQYLLWGLPMAAIVVGGGLWLTLGTGPTPPPPAAEITVVTASGLPTEPGLELVVGETVALSATVTATDGSLILNPDLAWRSTDESLATVDSHGTVLALAAGSLTVTASVGNVVWEFPLDIAEGPSGGAIIAESADSPRGEAPGSETGMPEQEPAPTVVPPPPPNGELLLRIGPRGARVEVDGEVQGEDLRFLPLSLPPGPHRLRLEILGFMPVDTVVEIISGDTTQIMKTLRRIG